MVWFCFKSSLGQKKAEEMVHVLNTVKTCQGVMELSLNHTRIILFPSACIQKYLQDEIKTNDVSGTEGDAPVLSWH